MSDDFFETHDDEQPLLQRKSPKEHTTFDITAMIDLVFMMNIFFLVTSIAGALVKLDLAPAKHATAVESEDATVVTLMESGPNGDTAVYLGDGPKGQLLPTPAAQTNAIRSAVEDSIKRGQTKVIIKAERNVRSRHVARVAAAAGSVDGAELNLAVWETD